MLSFSKQIAQIIATSRLRDGKVGWRYRHAKSFDDGLALFIEFATDQLHDLASFHTESVSQSKAEILTLPDKQQSKGRKFLAESRYTLADLVLEFGVLAEIYELEFPLDAKSSEALKIALDHGESGILRELDLLHERANDLELQGSFDGRDDNIDEDSDCQRRRIAIAAIKALSLEVLFSMLTNGNIPEHLSLGKEI